MLTLAFNVARLSRHSGKKAAYTVVYLFGFCALRCRSLFFALLCLWVDLFCYTDLLSIYLQFKRLESGVGGV